MSKLSFDFLTRAGHSNLEIQTRVIGNFLNDKETSNLTYAWKRDELLTMELVEVSHVSHSNFQEIVEVSGDQVAIQYKA